MLLERTGEGLRIERELYGVETSRLAHIDRLESIGEPGNFRIELEVEPLAGGPSLAAQAYAKSPALATPRHSGPLARYEDRRFVPPGARPSQR